MPDTQRLSSLLAFLPLGEPGSPERRACVLGTFTDPAVTAAFVRHYAQRARLATQPPTSSTP